MNFIFQLIPEVLTLRMNVGVVFMAYRDSLLAKILNS